MKKRVIIVSVFLIILLIALPLLCVFRDRIPTKIDSIEEVYDVFDVTLESDDILSEYSSYQIQTDYGRPSSDLCLKLDISHSDFESEIGYLGDKNHTIDAEDKYTIVNGINSLVPKDNRLTADSIIKGGYFFKAYEYVGVPVINICGFMTTQIVYWICVIEDGHEYVYVYTWVPRAYVLDVIH